MGLGCHRLEDTSGTSVTVNGNNNLDSAAAGSVVGFTGQGRRYGARVRQSMRIQAAPASG